MEQNKNISEEVNWDSLSDNEWTKRLEERIDIINNDRGEVRLPPPVHKLMDYEHARGLNNRLVTEDLIRHYADAVGDPNPIWRDPSYANSTRWGGFIAPPTYESCIAYGSSMSARLKISGILRMSAGHKHEYFVPIRPGDVFTIYDRFEGIEEKRVENKPYRMFVESAPRYYINQRNEVAAMETHRTIYLATPPGQREKKTNNKKMYSEKKRRRYTDEELDMIHAAYEDQLLGKNRRGAQTRYWEDVTEGEAIPTLIKGPCDVSDSVARSIVSCYPYAYAVKWAVIRNNLEHSPRHPETNEYCLRRDWHFDDVMAQACGFPYANNGGIQNEMMLVHAITDWMGDDGFVRSMDDQDRRMVFFGDMTYVKGQVSRKFIENGEHLVELKVWGENQDGQVHTKSTAVVKLPAKAEYKRPI